MTAAIFAAERGAGVLLLEHMEQIGKKILVTGNGKCNYTNRMQGVSHYRGDEPAFVMSAFAQFGLEQTLAFFEELGIYPKEKNGYFYPASEQASSVLEVMKMRLQRLGVTIHCGVGIRSIEKTDGSFCFDTKSGSYFGKNCILATGGYAAKKTGSDGSGFIYAKKFGHHLSEPVPALVQLVAKPPFEKEMAGVRTAANVKVFADGVLLHQDTGEVQLTDYGISGIPVFQVSRFAVRAMEEGQRVEALVDVAADIKEDDLVSMLKCAVNTRKHQSVSESLSGLFNKKLVMMICKDVGIEGNSSASDIDDDICQKLARYMKSLRYHITGYKGNDYAQVCQGGVDVSELNDNLESVDNPGIFFAGELVDIDGRCGGYNLQWAWSSGVVAAKSAFDYCNRQE